MIRKLKEDTAGFAAIIAASLCCILIILVLNVPEPVGLANNGDYTRVIYPAGIRYVDENPNKYDKYVPIYEMIITEDNAIQKLFNFVRMDYSVYEYKTSQSFVIVLSKILNLAYNKLTGIPVNNYNLFWQGLIYIGIFAFSAYLILKFIYKRFGPWIFLLASFAFIFVFCDQGYVLYFNSFYGEAIQYTFTFLVIGLFLRLLERRKEEKDGVMSYIIYYMTIIVMAYSKNAYAPIGMFFAPLPLVFAVHKQLMRRKVILVAGLTAFTILASVYALLLTPEWIGKDTNFNSVFAGVLKFSDTPKEDLRELGLDASYAVLKGRESYQSDYPIDIESEAFQAGFFEKVSKIKIALFYLKHPDRLIYALDYSADYSNYIRSRYLGNLQNPVQPQEQSYRFSLWEHFRILIGINNLWVTIAVFVITFGIFCYSIFFKRNTNIEFAVILIVILASAAFNFVIPYMSNGICDIAKHMFGFINFYDMLLVILLGYLIINGNLYIQKTRTKLPKKL